MPAIVFLFAGMARSYKCEVVLLGLRCNSLDNRPERLASRFKMA